MAANPKNVGGTGENFDTATSVVKIPFLRSPYNYDTKAASDDSAKASLNPGVSMTVQSQSDDTNLNILLARQGILGKMPENPRVPQYGDFSHITDFQSAMNAVIQAEDDFMAFPAEVRSRFDNNPQKMLDFVENPANMDEVKKLFGEKNVEQQIGGKSDAASATAGSASGGSTAGSSGGAGTAG